MASYDAITIIYNPKSTGPSQAKAQELYDALKMKLRRTTVILKPTKRAGHAEELAYKAARKHKKTLIISSSGDGGYHEVVNGVLRAQSEGAKPTVGLLPAGNANDHFHSLHGDKSLVEAIAKKKSYSIDALKLTAEVHGKPYERYAHSYIGLGLTPHVGRELNRHQLNRLLEMWLTLKVFLTLRPVHLVVEGKPRTFYSLIFSNVRRMGKFLTISQIADARDGKFEVTRLVHGTKRHLFGHFFKGVVHGFRHSEQAKEFNFRTTRRTLVQLDGEVVRIDADTEATISIEPKVIHCII
jgi:diacylglycerol kinase (ATP)